MTVSEQLYKKLRSDGLDFFVSVPCKFLDGIISILENSDEVIYTPVTREEEGIGVLAGAFLAGKRPAILMQNSGLGNSYNAICSLLNYYEIPAIFIISHRGTEGETIDAQRPMGESTKKLLEAAFIPYREITHIDHLNLMDDFINSAFANTRPAALLFPQSFWEETGGSK
jgi:sulfopyruvate decarboxylase subunit alpha